MDKEAKKDGCGQLIYRLYFYLATRGSIEAKGSSAWIIGARKQAGLPLTDLTAALSFADLLDHLQISVQRATRLFLQTEPPTQNLHRSKPLLLPRD